MEKCFEIENFGKTSAFASFLPGIAGVKGVPIWCYYVNRGQGVVSFGVDNKDHAIMEFYPAHMAYQNVKRTGFRTFVRRNGSFFEAFADENVKHSMNIEMNALNIKEENEANGTTTEVSYFILPEEKVGALVRLVTITNTGDAADFEIMDGMPNVIPFGVGQDSMKNMTQTAKAWMQVEDHQTGRPFYRVRVSMDDTAAVSDIVAGNFAAAYDEAGNPLSVVVDPEAVFGYDLSLGTPVVFATEGISGVEAVTENISNLLPTCFFKRAVRLEKGQQIKFYELVGQVSDKSICHELLDTIKGAEYFEAKQLRAKEIVEQLVADVDTKTANPDFDAYTRYTYMDNVLRGGYPISLGSKIFYVYSRKHGDLERDYNYFSMLPEFFSQGNGNFRDVNQNRRCDTFFNPKVGTENIRLFYNLIQLDGYNPLAIEKKTYTHPKMDKPFTPGELYAKCEAKYGDGADEQFAMIMEEAEGEINAKFGEGYWSDHWTYNLDLIQEYLEIYPDMEAELLFDESYTYFKSCAFINPRHKRYAKTANGIRQYHALDESKTRDPKEKLVTVNGQVYKTSLLEKLLLLSTLKFAALDSYGMGVEMEGGKPGWYDALNGLPGMLGSSMAETYELKRMVTYTIGALNRNFATVRVTKELVELMTQIKNLIVDQMPSIERDESIISFWNKLNDIKEAYREATYEGISGDKLELSAKEISEFLELVDKVLAIGIEKAKSFSANGVIPTYFSFEVTDYNEDENGIYPVSIRVCEMPDFLEGAVRYFKIADGADTKAAVYSNVKNSGLYDTKLHMYKVNSALEKASYEIGRCRAFTPGWLENESIWLHMEYKYLLEVLKCGLYQEFFADFKDAAVPFLDPAVYGRSILENSSFIVSSSNPNEKIHGKGFVARLSGSTIEFISMWKLMMFGSAPFKMVDGELTFNLEPAIPDYLIPEDGIVEATFMADTKVVYHLQQGKSYIPGKYTVDSVECTYGPDYNNEPVAEAIRAGKVSKIDVVIH